MAADPLLPSPGQLFGNRVSREASTEEIAEGKVSVQRQRQTDRKEKKKRILQNDNYKTRQEKISFIKKKYSCESISKIDFGYLYDWYQHSERGTVWKQVNTTGDVSEVNLLMHLRSCCGQTVYDHCSPHIYRKPLQCPRSIWHRGSKADTIHCDLHCGFTTTRSIRNQTRG